MSLSVIVPVHNCEGTITEDFWALAQAVSQGHPDWELVLVDRGSRDRTPEILERLRHHEPRLNLIYQSRPKCLGDAIRSGLLQARGEILVVLDRAGEWDLTGLGQMLAALEQADAVVGYRRKGPRVRHHWLAQRLFSWWLKLPPEFREGGIFACRRDLFLRLGFGGKDRDVFGEIPARMVRLGGAPLLVPVPFFPRKGSPDRPLGPTVGECYRLFLGLGQPPQRPLFSPVHETSTALLRLEFLSSQHQNSPGRLSLE